MTDFYQFEINNSFFCKDTFYKRKVNITFPFEVVIYYSYLIIIYRGHDYYYEMINNFIRYHDFCKLMQSFTGFDCDNNKEILTTVSPY